MTLSRRRRLVITSAVALLLFLAGAAVVVWLLSRPEAPYRPGEEIEGLTASLTRSIPGDYRPVRFVDATEEAGISFHHFSGKRTSQLPEDMGSGAAWGDYDNDGWLDLFVVNEVGPLSLEDIQSSPAHSALYHNRGDGTFDEVSGDAGVDFRGWGMAAAWGDYDNDGWTDLFVSSYGENTLYHNNGDGTFSDVTYPAGMGRRKGFWTGASWADFNRDGFLDLYVCGYVRYSHQDALRSSMQYDVEVPASLNPSSFQPERNLLFRNNGDGTFSEIGAQAGVENVQGRSLSAAWSDFDEDGWPDLYVANDVSDNVLYRNLGNEQFEEISHGSWVADYRGAMGLGVGDWDGDLDMDIFITHWIAQENALYSNLRSQFGKESPSSFIRTKFMDEADRHGLGQIALDYIGWGTSFFDFDNDGRLDLFTVNGSTFQQKKAPWLLVPMPNQLFWNGGASEGFYDVSEVSGEIFQREYVGRGAAFGDYDNDGDVDIFVVNNGGPGILLRNEGGNRNNWLEVALEGTESNRSAFGAKLRLVADRTVQIRQIGAQPSYCSQNSLVEHFGLGSASGVDTLEIIWPSGIRQAFHDLEANQTVRILEGNVTYEGRFSSERERVRRFWEIYRSATGYRVSGQPRKAATAYERALMLNDRHEDGLYYMGNMYMELGEYGRAQKAWERLLQVNPSSIRALIQLGNLHLQFDREELFDIEAAKHRFLMALKINKEETTSLIRLGEIALIGGALAKAQGYFDPVIASDYESAEACLLNGYIEWKMGNSAKALSLLEKAVAHSQVLEPAPGNDVPREGDTRTGKPLLFPERAEGPSPFRAHMSDLGELEISDVSRVYEGRYKQLEDFLGEIRRKIQ
ncbi:MAG: FG-GAP-like repeat-containing protein [Fidelibacterota bacterium]